MNVVCKVGRRNSEVFGVQILARSTRVVSGCCAKIWISPKNDQVSPTRHYHWQTMLDCKAPFSANKSSYESYESRTGRCSKTHCLNRFSSWQNASTNSSLIGRFRTNGRWVQPSWSPGFCLKSLSVFNNDSDINKQNWWMTVFPKQMQPYLVVARLDRPIGYWLLFLPCSWSISLAAPAGSLPTFELLTLFFIGSVLMRGAGCVINDMWDADLDKKVAATGETCMVDGGFMLWPADGNSLEAVLKPAQQVARTSSRPLAAGSITYFQALIFLGCQLSFALGILLSLNFQSIILGASSLPLVATYPLMKRITFWPQLFLGLTLNWGCLLGWTAVTGVLDCSVCLPLYAAAISWTLFYDTIYAFQDVDDDGQVGVKSTALLFGDSAKPWLGVFSAVIIVNLVAVGVNSAQTWPFYLGLAGVASHLTWQATQVDLSQPKDCLSKFKSNKWLGILLFASIVASTLRKPDAEKTKAINS